MRRAQALGGVYQLASRKHYLSCRVITVTVIDASPYSVANASRSGDQVFQLRLQNWGNTGVAGNGGSGGTFQLAPSTSVKALSIAPQSAFDRCVVEYFVPVNRGDNEFVPQFYLLSTEQPLVWGLRGAPASQENRGAIRLLAATGTGLDPNPYRNGVLYGDTYQVEGGTTAPFGTAMDVRAFDPERMELIVDVALDERGVGSRTTKRSPFRDSFRGSIPPLIPVNGVEFVLYVVPITGRKKITITARLLPASADVWDIRFSITTFLSTTLDQVEKQVAPLPLGAVATLSDAAGDTFQTTIDNPGGDFCIFYATRTAGAGAVPLFVGLVAED